MNIKKTIYSSILIVPLLFGGIASASAPATVDMDNNSNKYEASYSGVNPVLDMDGGSVRLSVYFDYPVGSAYPKSIHHKHWYQPSEKFIYGNMSVSDIYLLHNGYVRVWYTGDLY